MVGNYPPSLRHIYEPGRDYQAKLKLFACSQVPDSPSRQANRYLMPSVELGRNPWQIYSRAAQVPEVPEEYPVD